MSYLGEIKLGANLTFYANTFTPATGAAVDADAVPDYRIYEEETGTPLLTGSMAKLDDANTTGFYSEQVAVSGANGFEAGKSYCVRITGVVGGVTGAQVDSFGVAVLSTDDLATAAALATVQSDADDIQARLPAALTADGNIKADTLRVNGTPQTAGNIIGDTNDIQARLPAALTADGNIKADTLRVGGTLQTGGDIIADTNDLQARLPAALSGGRIDASVGAIGAGAITAASISADAITAAKIADGAIDAATFAAGALDAAALSTDAANKFADALLKRDWTAVTGEAARSMLNALRFLRNKWSVAAATLTVTKEDDTTTAWTGALTTTPAADPVTGVDPT